MIGLVAYAAVSVALQLCLVQHMVRSGVWDDDSIAHSYAWILALLWPIAIPFVLMCLATMAISRRLLGQHPDHDETGGGEG